MEQTNIFGNIRKLTMKQKNSFSCIRKITMRNTNQYVKNKLMQQIKKEFWQNKTISINKFKNMLFHLYGIDFTTNLFNENIKLTTDEFEAIRNIVLQESHISSIKLLKHLQKISYEGIDKGQKYFITINIL